MGILKSSVLDCSFRACCCLLLAPVTQLESQLAAYLNNKRLLSSARQLDEPRQTEKTIEKERDRDRESERDKGR